MVFTLCIVPAFSASISLGDASGTASKGQANNHSRGRTAMSSVAPLADGTSVLAFSSDVHNSSGNVAANRLNDWLEVVESMYGSVDCMGFCGDMGSASAGESDFWTLTQAVIDVVDDHDIPGVYTTGNHEHYNGNYSSTTNSVKDYYIVDQEGVNGSNYRIYALGTDNWNSSSDNYTTGQVTKLTNYLNSVDSSKPIFILTHFPLHTCSSSSSWWSSRTTANADLVIDALNEGAAAGKTIILLWGHNHTMSDSFYDEIYTPGFSIPYTSSASKTIQFYYAAAGCMSDSEYGSGSASVKGKGLVVTVNGSDLDFHYYDAAGTDVTENASTAEPTPTPVPSSGSQPVDGKTYVIISSDGYALTSEGDSVGYTNGGGSSSAEYNYIGLVGKAYTLGETVTTDLLWTFSASGNGFFIKSQDDRYLNAVYVSNESGGYDSTLKLDSVTDVWLVNGDLLQSTNASQSDAGEKYLTHGNGDESNVNMFAVRSESNATSFVIYEYNSEGEYIGTEEPAPTAQPGSLTQASALEDGVTYVIVSDDDYALTCNTTDATFSNSGSGSQLYSYSGLDGVAFSTGMTVTSDMLWTAEASGSGFLLKDQTGRYLNGSYTSNSSSGYDGVLAVNDTTDVWSLSSSKLKSENASAGSSSDKFLCHGSGSSSNVVNVFSVRSSSSAATVTLYAFGGTASPTNEPTPTPAASTTETRYIETTALTSGNDYILAVGTGTTVNAITYISGSSSSSSSITSTALTLTDGYIVTDNQYVVWTRTSDGYFQNGSRYLYPSSSNGLMSYTSGREINYSNGQLSFETSSSGTYYITYNDGFGTSSSASSAASFRLFVKTEVYIGGDPTPTPTPTPEPTAVPTVEPGTLTQVSAFENGKTYVIVADDGYALTCNTTDASFSNTGSGSQLYAYTGLAGVVFSEDSVTNDMLWTAEESGSGYLLLDQSGRYLNATYTANSSNGYNGNLAVDSTADVWTLTSGKLKSANASAGSSSDKYLSHGDGSSTMVNVFSVRSSSSAATVTIYEYAGSVSPTDDPTPTPTPTAEPTPTPTPEPTNEVEIRYVETDTLEADNDYIIAVMTGENTVAAIAYADSVSAVSLDLITGNGFDYIKTDDESVVWNRTSSDFFLQGERYLYPTSGGTITTYSGGRAISYENGHMFFATSSSGTYYITYADGSFGTSSSESSAANIRIFVKTEVEVGDEPSYTPGDVNFDGVVNASDAILVMRYTLSIITLTDVQQLAADINNSGTIDASDAIMIMRKVLGIIA